MMENFIKHIKGLDGVHTVELEPEGHIYVTVIRADGDIIMGSYTTCFRLLRKDLKTKKRFLKALERGHNPYNHLSSERQSESEIPLN